MKETIISLIAKNCDWRKTVAKSYFDECENRLDRLESMLPSGSGIDAGCKIVREESGSDKVVIAFSWHHMNEDGYYDGWTQHKLIVKPKLWNDFDMRITGRDRGGIKDYLYDLFGEVLKTPTQEK